MNTHVHPRYKHGFLATDPIAQYCKNLSMKQNALEKELRENTVKDSQNHRILGDPEVLQLGKNMIRLIKAKRVLDIGTYTGASALSWAIALPPDGEVLSMDVTHANLDSVGRPVFEKNSQIAKKMNFKLGPAIETLDALIADGQSEKWDFAFIAADKESYPDYYERCVQLLRPGGVILINNAIGQVFTVIQTHNGECIDKTNQKAAKDDRVDNILLKMGDGVHLIFKL